MCFSSAEWIWITAYYDAVPERKWKLTFQQIPLPSAFLQAFIPQERHSQNPQVMMIMMKNPRNSKYITPIQSKNINAWITFIQLSIYTKVSRFFSFTFSSIICLISITLILHFTRHLSRISHYLIKLSCHSALSCHFFFWAHVLHTGSASISVACCFFTRHVFWHFVLEPNASN